MDLNKIILDFSIIEPEKEIAIIGSANFDIDREFEIQELENKEYSQHISGLFILNREDDEDDIDEVQFYEKDDDDEEEEEKQMQRKKRKFEYPLLFLIQHMGYNDLQQDQTSSSTSFIYLSHSIIRILNQNGYLNNEIENSKIVNSIINQPTLWMQAIQTKQHFQQIKQDLQMIKTYLRETSKTSFINNNSMMESFKSQENIKSNMMMSLIQQRPSMAIQSSQYFINDFTYSQNELIQQLQVQNQEINASLQLYKKQYNQRKNKFDQQFINEENYNQESHTNQSNNRKCMCKKHQQMRDEQYLKDLQSVVEILENQYEADIEANIIVLPSYMYPKLSNIQIATFPASKTKLAISNILNYK